MALENAWTADATVSGARLLPSIELIGAAIKDARKARDKEGNKIPMIKAAFQELGKDTVDAEDLRKRVNTVVRAYTKVLIVIEH